MKGLRLAALLAAAGLFAPIALAGTICPSFSGDPIVSSTGCNAVITISSTGAVSVAITDTHPYDGIEDQLVGVVNNFSTSVSSLGLNGGSNAIFAFEPLTSGSRDGIDVFLGIAANSQDAAHGDTGYGGVNGYFTGINGALTTGTVNFITPIAGGGGTSYFSLELDPTSGSFTAGPSVPEPESLLLLGTGVLGLAGTLRRRFLK